MPFFFSFRGMDGNEAHGIFGAAIAGVLLVAGMNAGAAEGASADREQMVAEIVQITHDTRLETGRAVLRESTLAAMRKVERHRFVPPSQEAHAYENRPLAIGLGQTISQPFIVALMTDLMDLQPGTRVLEVGTGSGYQAAVLAEIASAVYSIEIVEPLAREAARALAAAGYRNVHTRVGDGYAGWPEAAPFDAVMVTAAAPHVPQPLIDQLKNGGRMVIPVGEPAGAQSLYVIEKNAGGGVIRRKVLDVRFVPLTRGP